MKLNFKGRIIKLVSLYFRYAMSTFMTHLRWGRSLLPAGYIKELTNTKTPRMKQWISDNKRTVSPEREGRKCVHYQVSPSIYRVDCGGTVAWLAENRWQQKRVTPSLPEKQASAMSARLISFPLPPRFLPKRMLAFTLSRIAWPRKCDSIFGNL